MRVIYGDTIIRSNFGSSKMAGRPPKKCIFCNGERSWDPVAEKFIKHDNCREWYGDHYHDGGGPHQALITRRLENEAVALKLIAEAEEENNKAAQSARSVAVEADAKFIAKQEENEDKKLAAANKRRCLGD